MEYLLVILVITLFGVIFWPNLKWWYGVYIKPSLIQDFPEELPPFCFECNATDCKGCKAHQAYLKNHSEGWTEFYTMKYGNPKNIEKTLTYVGDSDISNK